VVPARLSVTALRHRARVLARQLEVRMLIIDEIHSMLAGTFREQRIILNSLRFLANDLCASRWSAWARKKPSRRS
jgi:replicative DNA helicase